jgi:biotin synthase
VIVLNYEEILYKDTLVKEDLVYLLTDNDPEHMKKLFAHAYSIKEKNVGKKVYYRGLVELSNVCAKNCYYCGIRRENRNVERYTMTEDQIVEQSLSAFRMRYGSVVLQSGECTGRSFTDMITRIIKRIKHDTIGALGITLSLGEQSPEVYQEWYNAGAHRYLLRIETSNPELYAKLHPADHSYAARVSCLETLRSIGYYGGTGVMIGLPGQTAEHLADDIIFFRIVDADMIGMGPYIPHHDAPLPGDRAIMSDKERFNLSLRMIALVRIFLKDVNIAATTALQALDPSGREKGLLAGANIIMPNVTDTSFRRGYQLYDNKPCLDENAGECRGCLETRITSIGETVGYDDWGDSPHHVKNDVRG